jgi:arabinan endo-1,5-alpha-L-arabinosidase
MQPSSKALWCAAALFAVLRLSPAAPAPGPAFPRIHDPSTIVKAGGEYWFFSTGVGIPSFRSTNLVNWAPGPRVFASPPVWTTNTIVGNTGHFWAPDILLVSNTYHLYYSVSTFGKNTSVIALATNPVLDPAAPAYAWTDRGMVVSAVSNSNHNAIDPSLLRDADGRLWMAYGSYWSGIKLVELNPHTGLRIAPNSPLYSLAWNKSIEAAGLYRRGMDYYLFVNWGTCCRGTNSTYEIRVGRSSVITGPYLDRDGKDLMQGGGSLFLEATGKRIGPGHAAVLKEGDKEYLSYHYYNADRGGRPDIEIVPLGWTPDGWPVPGKPMRE